MSCIICETSGRRAFGCPQCFAASSAGRQADRRSLQEQRDDAARQLDAALADKATYQRQQLQLHHLAAERLVLRQRAAEAERQLTEVTQRTQAAQRRLQQRRQHLQEAQHDLAALSRQMQAAAAPQRNQQAAACLRSMEALAREQRVKVMRRVVEILPLSLVPAARPAAAAAKRDAAAICSLPLPDGQMEMAEVARLSRTLGSALGYLALLLDVLSRFLQLPVPHRTAFQGSTSRLWQPEGFFDTRATPPYDALRLCWPPASDGGSALSTLTALAGSAGGGGYGGGAAAAAAAQRQEQQLRAALLALQRAAGMLVYARLGPEAGLRVPEDQAPLTWLAKLCRLLAAETRGGASGGGRTAASSGRDLAASAVLGKGGRDGGTCTPSSRSVLLQDGRGGDEGAEDDWEHLPAHGMMPPRPWELEDVEHWEQANFADHHNGSTWSGGGNSAPQLGGGNAVAALLVWTAATLKRGLGTAAGLGGPATSGGS